MPEELLYIGTKLIRAFPCDKHSFLRGQGKDIPDEENQHGYQVTYPDGYISWSPKIVFETTYREVTVKEKELIEGIDRSLKYADSGDLSGPET